MTSKGHMESILILSRFITQKSFLNLESIQFKLHRFTLSCFHFKADKPEYKCFYTYNGAIFDVKIYCKIQPQN